MTTNKSIFEVLNSIDVSGYVEKKNGLTYLSWANAWRELKKAYPASFYTVYEDKEGRIYHSDGKTAWVKTGVTVVDEDKTLEHIEYLPVLDFRNCSISVEKLTSFDVNKSIQRSLTKAAARHGLGLSLYAGEDLPETGIEYKKRMHATLKTPTVSVAPKSTTQLDAARKAQLLKMMIQKLGEIGCTDKEAILAFITNILMHKVESSQALTVDDCKKVIAAIEGLNTTV